MSKVAITGNASGTGTFTIASPNSNTDRTLNLPDEAGTVLTSASTVAASQITGALNATGSAPIYACRAWVNFNGQSTVAIRGSGNVSSITDGGTGTYTVNFTTAMPDANYCFSVSDNYYGLAYPSDVISTTAIRVFSVDAGFSLRDASQMSVAIFR